MSETTKALLKEWEALKAIGSRSGDHYVTSASAVERVDDLIMQIVEVGDE